MGLPPKQINFAQKNGFEEQILKAIFLCKPPSAHRA